MIDIGSLPKAPEEAFAILIDKLVDEIPTGSTDIVHFLGQGSERANTIRTLTKLCSVASVRISGNELKQLATEALQYRKGQSLGEARLKLEGVQGLMFAMQFDQHFINAQDVEDFDSAHLDEGDKSEIREQLAKARSLTENAGYLSDDHKRRVTHRISQVENELFKEVSGFKAFIAAGYEASGLVRQFGDDAMPLAEAIQTAKTITERKVVGNQRIEADEKPKQLPKPDE